MMARGNNLKNTAYAVKAIMESKPETRSNDDLLYLVLVKAYGLETGFDLLNMSFRYFMNYHALYGIPSFETVRRARQKVQQLHPELKACESVESARAELATDYRAFALADSVC